VLLRRSLRVGLLLSCLVVLGLTACAVGDPQPTTNVSDTGATLHGDVYSNLDGDTDYWWRYGETTAYGSETPHGTIAISDEDPHPVSEPVTGLTPSTTYHFQFCVKDAQESPPRICTSDQTFTTDPPPDGSLIAFASDRDNPNDDIWTMDSNGNHPTNLTNSSSFESTPAWSPNRSKIAYGRDGEIYAMDADGSDQTNLSNDSASDAEPAWSPDGDQIAFSRCGEYCEIWVMDADGSNQAKLTNEVGTDTVDSQPAWSPDGTKIAFYSDRDSIPGFGIDNIYVMDADGGNQTNLTNTNDSADGEGSPAWSPDGSKIAFGAFRVDNWEIYVMEADGSDQTNVSNNPGFDVEPTWSPDGGKIAFQALRDGSDASEIWVMDADGSDQANFTEHLADDTLPDWSSLP
jgi:Tol biopolymer transport system component